MDQISHYLALVAEYPSYFTQNDLLPLELNERNIRQFFKDTNKPVGVIYNSPFHTFIADLVKAPDGSYYTYTRLLHPASADGVALIPIYQDKIVLLRQFRHGSRSYEYELPRGFLEPDLTAKENAKKEIKEELGSDVKKITYEGNFLPNSSLSPGTVDIFTVEITEPLQLCAAEGIQSYSLCTMAEIKELIKQNNIRDSFTICAVSKYLLNH